MSDFQFFGGNTPAVKFAVEPVYSALCSLCMLTQDHLDRISSWVDSTKQHLTDEERKMAFHACRVAPYVALTRASSIEDLLLELSNTNPAVFVQVNVDRIIRKAHHNGLVDLPSEEQLANDESAYVDTVRRIHKKKGLTNEFKEDQERAEYRRLTNGSEHRDAVVEAVRTLWDKYLAADWERVQTVAEASVAAFQSIEIPGKDFAEQIRFVTERDVLPEEWINTLSQAREVVFIPSVHIGPFMILFEFDGTTAYVVGRARTPEGSTVHTSELDRSDLLIRLEALSDDTRLRVLEMAAGQGIVTTADVMERLELSQSSASRHLAQLTATGLLSVDASERTKRYRVNADRVDQVFAGLKSLISAADAVRQ